MVLRLQVHCQNIHRPVFYIHSPEDVVCSAHFLRKAPDNTGLLCKGPGGPLHDFLSQPIHPDNPPVLIVNYANFNADDIVRLNTLLDEKRSADYTPIPEQTILIGLINIAKPDCYQGADFYSRFDQCDHNPPNEEALLRILQRIPEKPENTPDMQRINLYHSRDWKSRLTGSWSINAGKLVFQEGLLLEALQGNKAIEICNGPWEDPEFTFFWQQLMTSGLELQGQRYVIDPARLYKSEDYDWKALTQNLESLANPPDMLLNPGNFSDYFHRYACMSTEKTLIALPGYIQQAADNQNARLQVHLTRSLAKEDWALLLETCQKQGITLQVHVAPGVKIPLVFQKILFSAERKTRPWDVAMESHSRLISSSDPDTTLAMILQKEPDCLVIDVSECKPSDLLLRMQPVFRKDLLVFEFTESEKALLNALNARKSVVLKGHISEELDDALADVLAKRQQGQVFGKLIIISHEKDRLNIFPEIEVHKVSPEDKQAFCKTPDDKMNWEEPLATIQARLQHPQGWEGLATLRTPIKALEPLDIVTSKEKAWAFHTARQEAVATVLARSPYAFIAGLSGVGKSTFIEKELFRNLPHSLHIGEQALENWAKDAAKGLKILFIDEANLSDRQWSEFEGLFNTAPSILINGTLHFLSADHKVIFAGNPVSYGDERSLSAFFIRHGQALIFDPLPLAVIYEQIIKPVFASTREEGAIADIAQPWLEVYHFLCQRSSTEILISPRELQMMALLTQARCAKMPELDARKVAAHYAFILAKNLVPEACQSLFNSKFEPAEPLPARPLSDKEKQSQFIITESRKKTANIIEDMLLLREFRTQALNDEQKYGGLGGLVLTGEPGTGKSELVMAMLRNLDFEERKPREKGENSGQKIFYHIRLSMSKADREKLLLKAFDEGAVVIIDEINSSTMMERLLNDLLMGKHPYRSDARPKNPGFMVIGTQNPVSMAGRRVASTALSRRLYSEELPPYTRHEMLEIIQGEAAAEPEIQKEFEDLVDSYIKNANLAKKRDCQPAPTFRDVLRIARKITENTALTALSSQKISLGKSQTLWSKIPDQDVQGNLNPEGKNYSDQKLSPF